MSVFVERFLKDCNNFLRIVCIREVMVMSDTAVISDTTIGEELMYDNTTVSKILGVQESTLRKYCTLMQKHNYEFNKNSVGHRIFYKKDVDVMKQIVDLKNSSSLTLNQSVKTILESDIEDIDDISNVETISNSDYTKLLEEFSTFRNEQMEFNKKLLEQLQKQEHYIKNSIEERDNKLMLALKESMETRRQLAAAAAEFEKVKRKKWWKFWN